MTPPRPRPRFTIRQVMAVTAGAAVLFALAAPSARTRGWGMAFALVAVYVAACAIVLKLIVWVDRP